MADRSGFPSSPDLLHELRPDGVLVLTLHRPERGNAWTVPLEAAYFAALAAAADDPAVRAVVLTGAGDSFCPGMDAARLTEISAGASIDLAHRPSVTEIRRFPKPLVAAINGACAGIGLVHALLCDVRFVADSARLSTAFTRRGLAGERTITWLLPRIVGLERALDLLLTARTISGTEAHELGLASRLSPRDTVLADAIAFAAQLSRCSPLAVALVREQVYADTHRSFAESSAVADALTVRTAAGPDFAESVQAWADGRSARFAPLPPGFDASAWTAGAQPAPGL